MLITYEMFQRFKCFKSPNPFVLEEYCFYFTVVNIDGEEDTGIAIS